MKRLLQPGSRRSTPFLTNQGLVAFLLTLSIFLPGSAGKAFGQIPELSAPKVIPPSPQAAGLAKYVDYPVDLSNGLVQISIPLYEITDGDLHVPLTLSYHASGLKPNMRSSHWLGDGWSLSTGPSLSRSIRGGADELFYQDSFASNPSPSYTSLEAIADQMVDVALDEYHYSLSGTSGRMYLRKLSSGGWKAVMVPSDPMPVSADASLTSVSMTDRQGTLYSFGGSSRQYHDYADHNFGGSYHQAPTSWKIRSMRSANTGRSITFSYTQPQTEILCSRYADAVVMVDRFSGQQQKSIPAVMVSDATVPGERTPYMYDNISRTLVPTTLAQLNLPAGYRFPAPSRTDITQYNSYIARIDFTGGYVLFGRHADVRRGLSTIEVHDRYGATVRKIVLSQTYDPLNFSLRLDSVSIMSATAEDGTTPETWTFRYNGQAPPRDTRGVDRWGYYNGKDDNRTLVPTIHTTAVSNMGMCEEVEVTIPGGDRECDEQAMQAGMLTSVTQPTGGTTVFCYEAHRYREAPTSEAGTGRTRLAGGLRIRQIQSYGSGGEVLYRNFHYGSSVGSVDGLGIRASVPEGTVDQSDTLFTYYRETDCTEFGGSLYSVTATYKERVWTDNTMASFSGEGGSSVVYPYVVETRSSDESGQATNGETRHTFDVATAHPHKVTGTDMVSDRKEGWKHGAQTGETVMGRRTVASANGGNSRGTWTPVWTVDSLLQEFVTSTYDHVVESGPETGEGALVDMQVFRRGRIYGMEPTPAQEQYRQIAFIRPSISQGRRLLVRKTDTAHESNGSISRQTEYRYDTWGNVELTIEEAGVPGCDRRVTSVRYPVTDTTSTGMEETMRSAGMTGVPVETSVFSEAGSSTSLLTTTRTEYSSHPCASGMFIAPSSQSLTIRGQGATERKIEFTEYDRRGNLLEQKGLDGERTVYLWGYGGARPVAQIQGSTWANIRGSVDTAALNSTNAAAIRSAVSSLRSRWETAPDVHVTTMEWLPLTGMTSITDPSGRTASYGYDGLGRLVTEKADGTTLHSYEYVYGDAAGMNHILTKTYKDINGTTSMDTYSFFDCFGRPVETLQENASTINGTPQDIVTCTTYDAFGRKSWEYMPTPVETSPSRPAGKFVPRDEIAWRSTLFHDWDVYAFGKTIYEDSPLDRPREEYGPGSLWHTRGKAVRTEHLSNQSSGDLSCRRYGVHGDSAVMCSGTWEQGSLYVTRVTDEDGNVSMTFTDRLGRTVLQRRMNGNDALDTHYVYDDLGLLRYVLTPEASAAMAQDGVFQDSSDPVAKQAYVYGYDGKGRLAAKKIPGCGTVLMRYDKADRLIFTQDGNQRTQGKWSYAFPDRFGREAAKGIWSSASVPDLQGVAVKALESASSTGPGRYTVNITVPAGSTLLSETYYDSHTFLLGEGSTLQYPLAADSPAGYDAPVTGAGLAKGLLTGSLVRLLDAPSGTPSDTRTSTVTAIYHDRFGRPVQTRSAEALGGFKDTHLALTLTGKTLNAEEKHTDALGHSDILVREMTYDQQERLVSETTTIGDAEQALRFAYDGIGRLTRREYGSDHLSPVPEVTETIGYNVRSWVTEQHSEVFDMSLRYDEPTLGTTPRYNGNIAEWEWHRGAGSPVNEWVLSYDGVGRMTDAVRRTGVLATSGSMTYATSSEVNPFSERNISYDRNGNILSITRYGQSPTLPEDGLVLSYDGNMISSAANAGSLHGGGTYTHDANGNVTHDALSGMDMEYNLLGLTKKVSSGGTTLAEYHYLADGTRLSAERGDGSGVLYRGSLIYTKDADGAVTLDCAPTSGGRIVHMMDGGRDKWTVQHFIRDHLGSVRAIVDSETGEVVETSDYLPFGKRWELTGGQASQTLTDQTNRWRFSGKEVQSFFNPSIPYNDFGARLHDPRTGRWLAIDPLAEKYLHVSPYTYCMGSPITMKDPLGLEGVKYTNSDGSKTVESNFVILLKKPIEISGDMSEKTVKRIERKNRRIDAENEFLIDQIRATLENAYNGEEGGSYNSNGELIHFKFNLIGVHSDETNDINKLSYENGLPSYKFHKRVLASAPVLTNGSTHGALGLFEGHTISISGIAPAITVAHEFGHSLGLSDSFSEVQSAVSKGLMDYPPALRLSSTEVDIIWEKALNKAIE